MRMFEKISVIMVGILIGMLFTIPISFMISVIPDNEEIEITEEETIELVSEEKVETIYCDSVPMSHAWQNWVITVCNAYSVEPELIFAICKTESNFNKDAKDYISGNHHGLMQLGPSARAYANNVLQRELNYFDEFDNVEAGIIYMAGILETTPDYHKALMVYNMGGTAAKQKWSEGIVTTGYSEKIMRDYNAFIEERSKR